MNQINISKILISGCVHGNEPLGKKVCDHIRLDKYKPFSIETCFANPRAFAKRKRFIDEDLNRAFPGKKNGSYEQRLAYFLANKIKKNDLLIDIHSTRSSFSSIAIITNFNKSTQNLIKYIPIKKIVLMGYDKFKKGTMVHQSKLGVGLEYGGGKSTKNYKKVLSDIDSFLKNLREDIPQFKKEIYKVYSAYKTPDNFVQNEKLREFKQIKKGDIIGKVNEKLIKSHSTFYPIFLGKGRYESILCLMATRKKLF